MISPFLATILSLFTAYENRHERWKLIGSLLAVAFFLSVGASGAWSSSG
jgi:hypothetical protein